jgi:hypothetical protein|tara:strand:+ start:351 stop:614 length:264 start_codon:yes stop_codon:yes gene_type:complete
MTQRITRRNKEIVATRPFFNKQSNRDEVIEKMTGRKEGYTTTELYREFPHLSPRTIREYVTNYNMERPDRKAVYCRCGSTEIHGSKQ